MDTTTDGIQALIEQGNLNGEYTEKDLTEAVQEGSDAAVASMASGQHLWLMDESSLDRRQNSYAVGWNSQYSTDENKRLWEQARLTSGIGYMPHITTQQPPQSSLTTDNDPSRSNGG